MKSKIILPLFIALSLAQPICSYAHTANNKAGVEQVHAEGKVLATMMALNKNEIAAGELADKKSSNAEVKQFALFMIKEHSANLNKAEQLRQKLGIQAVEGKRALQLQNKGKKVLSSLKKLHENAFNKTYINDMVRGHEEALSIIDTLMAESTNSKVKKYLSQTKTHVQQHLNKALAIQQALK